MAVAYPDEVADELAVLSETRNSYLDRCRRVAVGPSVSVVFENRRTLAFRLRELEEFTRHTHPEAVAPLLAWYAGLLPGPGRLSAAVTVRRPGRRPGRGFYGLAEAVAGGRFALRFGEDEVIGGVRPSRAGDRVLGPSFWLTFRFDGESREALADFTRPAAVTLDADDYYWQSEPLSYDVRRSLAEDLGAW